VVGGGEAGLAVLAELDAAGATEGVALLEPSDYHYDQPSWMRVGTEGVGKEETRQKAGDLIPPDVTWIQEPLAEIQADEHRVTTGSGQSIDYEVLVLALGVNARWDRIRGLRDSLGTNGICSVYGYEQAARTWEMIRAFEGGRAIFTAPSSPFKGAGAPLQILHKAESLWRETGAWEKTELVFATATEADYAGEDYAEIVERDAEDEHVHVYFGHDLVEVRPEQREAVFTVDKGQSQSQSVVAFDLLHVVPPMRPPAVIEESVLSYASGPQRGFLEVNPETLQHRHHDDIYGLGDAIGEAAVKTGQRAREQARRLAETLTERLRDA
jgi:sulfide:quinone oxidoreductase